MLRRGGGARVPSVDGMTTTPATELPLTTTHRPATEVRAFHLLTAGAVLAVVLSACGSLGAGAGAGAGAGDDGRAGTQTVQHVLTQPHPDEVLGEVAR